MVAPATQQEAIQQFIDLANEMKNRGRLDRGCVHRLNARLRGVLHLCGYRQ